MYSPPLHRKLLPWAYTLLFCIVAPTLLFYTAGYRYNTKKAAVEKHGTLVIDSTPAGASITLDGENDKDTTPATFQELAPGLHKIRVERTGYQPWEKTLEIRPERATFADRIHLFRKEPLIQLVHPGDVRSITANHDRDTLFILERISPSTTKARLLQSRGRISADIDLPNHPSDTVDARWQNDDRAVYLDDVGTESDTFIRVTNRGLQVTSTKTNAFWEGDNLVLPMHQTITRWNSRSGILTQETLSSSTLAYTEQGVHILEENGARSLMLQRTFSKQPFALPLGRWMFFDVQPNALLLRDGERWLWVNERSELPEAIPAEGTSLRFSPINTDTPNILVLRNNELFSWTSGQTPNLLLRQSIPLREAAWHRSGDTVFFSTDTTIEALDLDERGGRHRQVLAQFEQVRDFDLLGNVLYVAGTRQGERGVWMVTIE